MDSSSQLLMTSGTVGACPDCGEDRLLAPVEGGSPAEFCCTSCDAAVLLFDVEDDIVFGRRVA